LVKNRTEQETFEDILSLQHPSFDLVRGEFEYRLNKLYSHPLLGDLLDSGDIDYAIVDALEGFAGTKGRPLSISTEYAR
jgi:hypothetical protein